MSAVHTPASITEAVTIRLTATMMAKAFWELCSDEQCLFFAELNKVITDDYANRPKSNAWSLGEMQWLYLADTLAEDKPARDMLMAMAAPLYLHTLAFTEGRPS